MTKTDRETLSDALTAQAHVFDRAGAKQLARGLRRRASKILDGIHDAFDLAPAPVLQPIPVRKRD